MYNDVEWSRKVLRHGIGYFRHCTKNFGTLRLFREILFEFLSRAPARMIITARTSYDAGG